MYAIANYCACRMRNAGVFHQARFDRRKFHAVAAELHLPVRTAEVLKVTVRPCAHSITGSVDASQRGMLNKAFCRRFVEISISAR
jgi:hypothetical protein